MFKFSSIRRSIKTRAAVKVLSILFVPALLIFFAAAQARADEDIHYRIKPVPGTDRTDLEISVRFKAVNKLSVKFPDDCYGTPDLYKYVTEFRGEDGTAVARAASEAERIVTPSAVDGTVALNYTLSFTPGDMDKYPFSPNISANHFHVAGCQWMLRIGDDAQKKHYFFEINGAPQNWHLYSSIAADGNKSDIYASYDDLTQSRMGGGGGDEQVYNFKVRQNPVSVFVHGKFDIPQKEIFKSVERIVKLQRNWFGDYEQPFFNVVVAPRSGIMAGTAVKNFFVCFAKPETTSDELNLLIAHEMFHDWLPGKIRIRQDKKYSSVRYEWFSEGFTEYFARKLLTDSGLISEKSFVERVNRDIMNIANVPNHSAGYDDLIKQFDSTTKKLSYYRGVLIALNWETQIRKSGKNRGLSDFIRDLYQLCSKTGKQISEEEFFNFASGYGIDAKGDLERYIMRGESIPLPSGVFGTRYVPQETDVPPFDPGFSLGKTFETKKIAGVIENGPAYRAGLRNGMEFVRAKDYSPLASAWNITKPLVVVIKIDGREKTFSFLPRGAINKLLLFQPAGEK